MLLVMMTATDAAPYPLPPQEPRASNGLPEPEAATSAMDLLVTWAMKPTMEKMTNPANMLVHELMQQTMMESLRGGKGGASEGGAGKAGSWEPS